MKPKPAKKAWSGWCVFYCGKPEHFKSRMNKEERDYVENLSSSPCGFIEVGNYKCRRVTITLNTLHRKASP